MATQEQLTALQAVRQKLINTQKIAREQQIIVNQKQTEINQKQNEIRSLENDMRAAELTAKNEALGYDVMLLQYKEDFAQPMTPIDIDAEIKRLKTELGV